MDVQLRWIDLQDNKLLVDHLREFHPLLDGMNRLELAVKAGAMDDAGSHEFNSFRRKHFQSHREVLEHDH